tara:strand:- start:3220 stop:5529 length:2310 start_codon:yes stop_codon:yes gene_type:complete
MALGTPLPLLLSTVDSGYEIERSLRFNRDDSPKLTFTPSSTTNSKTFTLSFWFKVGQLSSTNTIIFEGNTSNANGFIIALQVDGTLYLYDQGVFQIWSLRKFRDRSAWYSCVVAMDTTQATDTNRVKVYINGVEEDLSTWEVGSGANRYPGQNNDLDINQTNEMAIGRSGWTGGNDHWDGYLAEFHSVDGTQLTPSSFGETNADTGQWIPIKYAGAHGTNGFYLNFSDNSGTTATTLGADSSANSNNWTPTNFSVAAGVGNDSLTDTPTNNYPTLNPVDGYSTAFYSGTNGNLDFNIADTSAIPYSTIAIPTSGKWYAEFTATDLESGCFGLKPIEDFGLFSEGYLYTYHGKIWKDNSETQTVAAISDGDIIGVAVDRSAQTVQFSKNGTNIGNTEALVAGTEYKYWIARYASSGGNPQGSVNFGQRAFSHQPTGFVGLCTSELPEPTIKKGSDYFNTVLYTGTGSDLAVTGVGFQTDWAWIKNRSNAGNWHDLYDSVRGVTKRIFSNETAAEQTQAQGLKAFSSDGFTVGNNSDVGSNGNTYVAWNWKESASAGFDIVSYTGTGSNPQTRSHGLGVAPEMIIVKSRDSSDHWGIYHHRVQATTASSATYFGRLDTNQAFEDHPTWNDTVPTSSIFTTQNHATVNLSGDNYIAYLFAGVEGYSKVGSYTGNGNANGTFIYLGFKPAFLLVKCTNSAENWEIYDNKRLGYNVDNNVLIPNLDDAEYTQDRVDLLSNGFKARINSGGINGSSKDYIYYALAETPFKYANAR